MQATDKKQCTKCGELKTLAAFPRNKNNNDGYHTICKGCNKAYREANKDRLNKKSMEYYATHKESASKYYAVYIPTNKEHITEVRNRYEAENRQDRRNSMKEYLKSPSGKLTQRRINYKRKSWGFNPLNKHFNGSEFHHLHKDLDGNEDHEIGLFIPKELHRSLYHNWKTGQGMDEINKLALEWYASSGEM